MMKTASRWIGIGFVALFSLACASSGSKPAGAPLILGAGISQTFQWDGSPKAEETTRYRPIVGTRGMVACDDREAAEWGAEVLRQGGNAIDAAVATGFAMAVTRPHYASLGGGGFMTYCPAPKAGKAQPCTIIDYREMAPGKASRDMYIRDGKPRTDLSQDGALASGVPGVPAGLLLALEKFGSMPRQKLLSHPIEIARRGYRFSGHSETALADRWDVMNDEGKRIFGCRKKGSAEPVPCPPGALVRQPDLARTLEAIAKSGAAGFYRGPVAQKIASGLQKAGGIMTVEDLAHYQAKIREPLTGTFRGMEIVTMPPPSAGGEAMLQMFRYAELADQAGAFDDGINSANSVHALTHAMTLAFADRAQYLGDPDFVKVPIAGLLNRDYLEKRWNSTWNPEQAAIPDTWGDPFAHEGHNTTHFSVMDGEGNAVAITTTVNNNFGSAFVPPGTGVVMNDEMDDFSIQPGTPNLFGLVGTEANAIAPGKRPLSSMTPTIVRDSAGNARIVMGAQGGPRITTSVFLALFNRIRFNLGITDAVIVPRFHHQWKPASLLLEFNGFSAETQNRLKDMGYELKGMTSSGKLHGIERFPESGRTWGAPDPRAEGAAVAE